MPIETNTIRRWLIDRLSRDRGDIADEEVAYDHLMTVAHDEFGRDDRIRILVSEVVASYF